MTRPQRPRGPLGTFQLHISPKQIKTFAATWFGEFGVDPVALTFCSHHTIAWCRWHSVANAHFDANPDSGDSSDQNAPWGADKETAVHKRMLSSSVPWRLCPKTAQRRRGEAGAECGVVHCRHAQRVMWDLEINFKNGSKQSKKMYPPATIGERLDPHQCA